MWHTNSSANICITYEKHTCTMRKYHNWRRCANSRVQTSGISLEKHDSSRKFKSSSKYNFITPLYGLQISIMYAPSTLAQHRKQLGMNKWVNALQMLQLLPTVSKTSIWSKNLLEYSSRVDLYLSLTIRGDVLRTRLELAGLCNVWQTNKQIQISKQSNAQ